MKRFVFLMLSFALCVSVAAAQSGVKGKVRDTKATASAAQK